LLSGDLNDWFNTIDIADRVHLRAASFCMAQGDNSALLIDLPAFILSLEFHWCWISIEN